MGIIFNSKLAKLAAQTPAARDRYVDFLRAISIVVVVLGHWLSSVIVRDAQGIRGYNAVGMIPGIWLTTWILQVMPLFFFVGGFSNMITCDSYKRKGQSLLDFYRARLARLFRPTFAFLFIIALIYTVLTGIIPDWYRYARIGIMVVLPLWFLGVYLFMVLLTPLMRAAHRRYGIGIPAALLVLAICMDIIAINAQIPMARWFNVAFVWLFVHQLGFFYADGTLTRLPRWLHGLIAATGLAALVVLTNIGIYPRSMVGTGFEKLSNMNPPTICIAALALWLIGLAMVLRGPATKWLSRSKPWMTVILANSMIMTLYLWHLVAFAIGYLLLRILGFGQDMTKLTTFWIERPLWICVPGIILVMLVTAFQRFEKTPTGGGASV
jgi:peptidoglycan/LPS O-acetylase OafA/YrhL